MKFMALGGTNMVGASCYYLELDGKHLLLDCGKGFLPQVKKTYGPDFGVLLEKTSLDSLAQIDAILISHGHFDHIAALPWLTDQCWNTPVYATTMTKNLGGQLLMDCTAYQDAREQLQRELQIDRALMKIQSVSYGRSVKIGTVNVTFYPAGHIPGAAMIYLEAKEGNVLYTGDFSLEGSNLTPPVQLPPELRIDVMILCGLHTKHPKWQRRTGVEEELRQAILWAQQGERVCLKTKQLTKGLEILKLIQQMNFQGKVYLDEAIWTVAERMEQVGVQILSANCKKMNCTTPIEAGLLIGSHKNSQYTDRQLDIDLSLHTDLFGCSKLVRQCKPQVVFTVHAPDGREQGDNIVFQNLLSETTVLYPQKGVMYTSQ